MKLLILGLKFAPAHAIHINAFLHFAQPSDFTIVASKHYKPLLDAPAGGLFLLDGRGGIHFFLDTLLFACRLVLNLGALRRAAFGADVFVQCPHFLNPLALLLFRLARARSITYYLHEPSSWRSKNLNGDGLIRSVVTHASQAIDCALADLTFVSDTARASRAGSVAQHARRLAAAPLLFKPGSIAREGRRYRVTYVGATTRNRAFEQFLAIASAAHRVHPELIPTVLTSSVIPAEVRDRYPTINVLGGRAFSEQEKASVLGDSLIVWNIYTKAYAQSGVTVDALRFGCPLLISPFEPLQGVLKACSVVIPLPVNSDQVLRGIDHVARNFAEMSMAALALFPALGGRQAWDTFYRPHFQ